jgi:hypothetical protein
LNKVIPVLSRAGFLFIFDFCDKYPRGHRLKNDITLLVSLVSGAIIVTSMTRMLIYYQEFSISIVQYVDFANVLMYGLDIIFNLKFQFAVLLAIYISWDYITWCRVPFWISFLYAVPAFIIWWIYYKDLPNYTLGLVELLNWAAFLGASGAFVCLYRFVPDKIEILFALLFMGFLFFCARSIAKHEIAAVIHFNNFYGTTIQFKDSGRAPIVTDCKTHLLGSTKDFVFLKSEAMESALILPMSEVSEFVVHVIDPDSAKNLCLDTKQGPKKGQRKSNEGR